MECSVNLFSVVTLVSVNFYYFSVSYSSTWVGLVCIFISVLCIEFNRIESVELQQMKYGLV